MSTASKVGANLLADIPSMGEILFVGWLAVGIALIVTMAIAGYALMVARRGN